MVQLLSYANMAIGGSKNMQVYSRMGLSVRRLLTGLVNSKGGSMKYVATVQQKLPRSYSQAPRSFEKNVEMKKGDWICERCSFLNFARNSQCRQCDEHRPKKTLTGGEWECPECNFYNFGRNVVCLRCDCKKPGDNRFLSPTSTVGLSAATSSFEGNTKSTKDGIEEEQQWFTKIVELEKSSEMSCSVAYGDLPETMKAGDNRFDASARHSGIKPDQIDHGTNSVENSNTVNVGQIHPGMFSSISQIEQHNEPNAGLDTKVPIQQQMAREESSSQLRDNNNVREQTEKSERWFKELRKVEESPDGISDNDFPETMPIRKGENQFVIGKKKDRSLTSPIYKRRVAMEQAGKNNYVPFVPFPPGYFAKDKPQEGSESTHSNEASNDVNRNPTTSDFDPSNSVDGYSKSQDSSENASVRASWGEKSLEGSAVKEPDPLDMSEEAKAERWFRRVAQIKDISELSQIPDEDFPSIMPMRKGVNRFVVSKRKTPLERRLTSPQYRRNLPAVSTDPIKKETDSNQES